jgi:hypothetical protein
MYKLSIQALTQRVEKALELKKLMDESFEVQDNRHLKLVIMAAISDAYSDGLLFGKDSKAPIAYKKDKNCTCDVDKSVCVVHPAM